MFKDSAGGYAGYLPGTGLIAASHATEWAANLSAHLKFFLMKQGWTLDTIKKLINKSFGHVVAKSANKAKWDRQIKTVISSPLIRQAEHNADLDSTFIDQNMGLASWEREAMEEANKKKTGDTGAHMADL